MDRSIQFIWMGFHDNQVSLNPFNFLLFKINGKQMKEQFMASIKNMKKYLLSYYFDFVMVQSNLSH